MRLAELYLMAMDLASLPLGGVVAAALLLLRVTSSRVEGRLLLLLLTSEREATSVTELRSGCSLLESRYSRGKCW